MAFPHVIADQKIKELSISAHRLKDINIQINDISENKTHFYSVDVKDCCDLSYAMMMALINYFDEQIENYDTHKYHIFTTDLLMYNILNDYLWKWKKNNWIMSHGNIAAYPDILSNLYDVLLRKKISFQMIKKKLHTPTLTYH